MSKRRGQALPPSPQGHRGRLERLWLPFTREQLTLARFATLAVGVRPGEASSGGKRDRGEGEGEDKEAKEARTELGEGEEEDHDSDDSSGGATTLSPTAEERAAGMIAAAKDLIRRAGAPDPDLRETLALRMASLVADVYALLQRRGDDLEAGARRRLRRYVRRIEAAQQELTGDTDMTQMPDDVLGGEGSGVESVDSDDSGDGGGASGFGNEDAMEESLIDEAGEGGEAAAPQRTQSEQQDSAIDEGVGEGGGTQGGGFSPSLAADDIALISDLEEDDEEEDGDDAAPGSLQPAAGPGDATQLEAMELDDGGAKRIRRLRGLRDEVVALLRDVPSAGPLPMELRKRALALRRLVAPFMGASEAARRMSGALSELLTREVADGGGGPSGVAPGPDAPGAPQGARIVGRATDVLVDGSRRHSFLLFQPPRSYSWLTEAGMRADPALLAILDAHPGEKGDDPRGDGFVVAVVRARGPTGRRQYRVRWTVEPQVPVKYAEAHDDGWLLRRQLVNPALADAFDRRQRDEDASGDEDGDDGDGGDGGEDASAGGTEAESQGAGVGGPSALKWSPAQGANRCLELHNSTQTPTQHSMPPLIHCTCTHSHTLTRHTRPPPTRPSHPCKSVPTCAGARFGMFCLLLRLLREQAGRCCPCVALSRSTAARTWERCGSTRRAACLR